MYNSIWARLGIAPTKNEAAIRRAYAEAARSCHPEEHPAEWSQLHDAYRQALQYARKVPEGLELFIAPQPWMPRRGSETGPEPAFVKEFRAALEQTDEATERFVSLIHEIKKKKKPVTSRDAAKLSALLPGLQIEKEDHAAANELLTFVSGSVFTREACGMLYYDLQDWLRSHPQAPRRSDLQRAVNALGQQREAVQQRNRDAMDAVFAWCAAAVCLLTLMASMDGGAFFGVIALAFCCGMAWRLKTKERLYLPSEARIKWRPLLMAALAVMILASTAGARHFAQMGTGEITRQEEDACPAFSPALHEGTSVYVNLNGAPEILCFFSKTSDISYRAGSTRYTNTITERGDYYLCEDENGDSLLVYVSEYKRGEFNNRTTSTLYGKTAKLDESGLYLPVLSPVFPNTEGGSPAVLQVDSLLEQGKTVRELGREIGENPVLRFTGSEPSFHTVHVGYEPGRMPYILCWSIRFGCIIQLILMLSRSIPLKKRLFDP